MVVVSVEDALAAAEPAHVVVDQAALVPLDLRERLALASLSYTEYLDPTLANIVGKPRSPFVKAVPLADAEAVELRVTRRMTASIAALTAGLVKRRGLRSGAYDDGVLVRAPGIGKYRTRLREETTLLAVRRAIVAINRDDFLVGRSLFVLHGRGQHPDVVDPIQAELARVARDLGIERSADELSWRATHVRAVVGNEADAAVLVLDDMHWANVRHRDVFLQMVTRACERIAIIGTEATLQPIRKHAGRVSVEELDRELRHREVRQRAVSRLEELRRRRDEADG